MSFAIFFPHDTLGPKKILTQTRLTFKSLLTLSITLMLMLYKFNMWNSFAVNQYLHFAFILLKYFLQVPYA